MLFGTQRPQVQVLSPRPKIRVSPMGDTDFLCLILWLMRSNFYTTIANKTVSHIFLSNSMTMLMVRKFVFVRMIVAVNTVRVQVRMNMPVFVNMNQITVGVFMSVSMFVFMCML